VIRRLPSAALSAPPEPISFVPSAPQSSPAPTPPVLDRKRASAALARALVALLGEELSARPEHVASVVERELSRVRGARHVTLHAHPADLALLEPVDDLCARLELSGVLTFSADASLERGGCVLESDLGEIDARLETRLALALSLLQNGWE
jgi:flagellar biosynthesis/type III secretory pathway protein FliH